MIIITMISPKVIQMKEPAYLNNSNIFSLKFFNIENVNIKYIEKLWTWMKSMVSLKTERVKFKNSKYFSKCFKILIQIRIIFYFKDRHFRH